MLARFNHRSKIAESTEASITSVSSENLSAHQYDDESERNALKEAIKLKDRVPKSERSPKKANNSNNKSASEKKPKQ